MGIFPVKIPLIDRGRKKGVVLTDLTMTWDGADIRDLVLLIDRTERSGRLLIDRTALRNLLVGDDLPADIVAMDIKGRTLAMAEDRSVTITDMDGRTITTGPPPADRDFAPRDCRENPADCEIPVCWPALFDHGELVSAALANGGYLCLAGQGCDGEGFDRTFLDRQAEGVIPASIVPDDLLWDCREISGLLRRLTTIELAGGRPNYADLPGYHGQDDSRWVLTKDAAGNCLVSPEAPVTPKTVMRREQVIMLRAGSGAAFVVGAEKDFKARARTPASQTLCFAMKDGDVETDPLLIHAVCPFCGRGHFIRAAYMDKDNPEILPMKCPCPHLAPPVIDRWRMKNKGDQVRVVFNAA